MQWRPSLTTRLTLAASAASLLPFAVGGLIFAFAPSDTVLGLVHADQDRALRLSVAELSERRSSLRERAAEIDDAEARAIIAADDADRLRTWFGRRGDRLVVEFRDERVRRPEDGPVAAYLALGSSGDAAGVAIVDPVDTQLLRPLARPHEFELAYVLNGEVQSSTRSAWEDELDAEVASDGTPVVRSGDLVVRSQALDPDGQTQLVAMTRGSRAGLLLGSRGEEIGVALALLVGIGVCCGVGAALVIDRSLRQVARRAERLAGGDFSSRLPVVGSDAGAVVARSLNELSEELQARIGHLQLAFDQLDRTLEAIDDGVCLWSRMGTLQVWNEAAERLTGVDAEAARNGGPTTEFLRSQLRTGRRRVLLPRGAGGTQVAVDLAVSQTRDGGTLQVFHDATRAISIEQARQNFLVTAAHELRTPLVSILGFSATLADPDVQLSDGVRAAAIARIHEESQRMRDLVERFFESSLLATDRIDVKAEDVDVLPVVERAWALVAAPGTRFEVIVPADCQVRADADALERVLSALLDNAVKYGNGTVRVRVEQAGDSRLSTIVEDEGRGIPAGDRDVVFEPFYRLDPEMRTSTGGSGLGLYVARRLAEAMGGEVEIAEPPDGRGTSVAVRLPAVEPAPDQPAEEPDAERVAR